MLNAAQKLILHTSCLVLSDEDFRYSLISLHDVAIENVKGEIEYCNQANTVIYKGNLGEKVLKLRMPTITKEQLKDYE